MFNIVPKIHSELDRLNDLQAIFDKYGENVKYSKNDYIFKLGDKVDKLFYMDRGLVVVAH